MPWKDQYGIEANTIEDGITEEMIEKMYPALKLPKIPTMDKKVCIEACIPGWQPIKWYRDRGINNLPPITVEEQAQAIAECVKAGANIIHVHPRNPDRPTTSNPSGGLPEVYAPELLGSILDRAYDLVGDFVTMTHMWIWDRSKSPYVNYIDDAKHVLELGKGNKWGQGSVIMTWGIHHHGEGDHGGQPFLDGMKWLEEHDVKPIYQMHMYRFFRIKRDLFDSGISKWKPYIINIHCGKHEDEQLDIDPWGHLETIKNIYLIRETLGEKDSRIGIYAGGRNWLPASVQGLLQGVELVRGGIEDQYWLWPHRDDISTYAAQTTEMLATIAKTLGREIATPKEVRQMLGMKITSADWK